MSSEPSEVQPIGDVEKRIRRHGHVLLGLLLASLIVVLAVGEFGFRAYVLETEVVWFWLGNAIAAALSATGILLAYWWGVEDISKQKARFALLCIFILLFVMGASSGLTRENAVGASMSLVVLEGKPPACELEGSVCRRFIASKDEPARQRLADIFYQKTGVNLLASNGDGESNNPPSDKAAVLRREWQQIEADHVKLKSALERAGAAARYTMLIYLGLATSMFVVGGVGFGRRASAA